MKRETFHWLLDHSIAFNRFIINQINERLVLKPILKPCLHRTVIYWFRYRRSIRES